MLGSDSHSLESRVVGDGRVDPLPVALVVDVVQPDPPLGVLVLADVGPVHPVLDRTKKVTVRVL